MNAQGVLINAPDAFDVPVLIRRSSPMDPGRRPNPSRIDAAWAKWPARGEVPPARMYRVSTTWRDVIDSAISVGRDPTAWLAAVPALAWSEIVARRSPLVAYLGRRQTSAAGATGFRVEPNVVYRDGTERTAQAAFGYRIGMTMADWACRGLMGLGPTTHSEARTPVEAGPAWSPATGLPDLIGDHPKSPSTWLIEAKGGRKLMRSALVKGAAQLSTPGLMQGPHLRVLCGTSLEPRLFMTIDIEEADSFGAPHWSDAADPEVDDDALLALARSRMLLYLCLTALPSTARQVVPIGFGATERGNRTGGATVTLLEQEPSTQAERRAAQDLDRYRRRPALERLDMLTGQVPGTDLIVGMSRRLFAACRSLAQVQAAAAAAVDVERPRGADDELDALQRADLALRSQERRLLYWEREHAMAREMANATRVGFTAGEEQPWEDLLSDQTPIRLNAPAGYLESATADTYLALDTRTATNWTP